MAAASDRPTLVPCTPENIPEQLRKLRRWAPWAAPWSDERQKYDKVPRRASNPACGLSNLSAAGWVSFDEAMAVYKERPDIIAGVGFLMTGVKGIVGIDLDHCVVNGEIAPWAHEIAAQLDSYTEISPSGTGLHVWVLGDLPEDWAAKLPGAEKVNGKEPGLDVYGGGKRFLTLTGERVPGTRATLRPVREGFLDSLKAKYHNGRRKAELLALAVPNVAGMEVPHLDDLDLPTRAYAYMTEGPNEGEDRSHRLISVGVALAKAGLSPEMALAVMVDNEHTMETALSKRNYDYDKAVEYLWTQHCRRGAAIVEEDAVLTYEHLVGDSGLPVAPPAKAEPTLEELLGGEPAEVAIDSPDFFEALDDEPEAPPASRDLAPVGLKKRFAFESVGQFLRRPPAQWIIKGLLPRASLAVLYGASGSGKTFFALDIAGCVARGAEWRGVPVAQGTVAYVVAEGASGFRDRAHAYCRQHKIDPDSFPVRILADAPNMMNNTDVTDIIAALKDLGPLAVVFLDTYARVMGNGNENEAQDVNRVVRNCDLIHKATGAIVVLVHHTGKDTTSGARGSSALRAAADAEIEVSRAKAFRTATITKMKDGQDEAEFKFQLASIAIGVDEEGEETTSCVVEHMADTPKENKVGGLPEITGKAQLAVYKLFGEHFSIAETTREAFLELARNHLESGRSPNWRKNINQPLDALIRTGHIIEAGEYLKLNTKM
ncbi:MAG: AAA family ATPase [Novosphingobium sp.]|nr:AAA family ATPase [Novosphingobium sp.]